VLAAGLGMVGVDIMRLVDNRLDRLDEFFRRMRRQFTDEEWVSINGNSMDSGEKQLANFFRHWTLKESYVKAVGTGLNIDLRTLNFSLEGELEKDKVEVGTKLSVNDKKADWKFEEILLDREHVVSVALESKHWDEDQVESFKVVHIEDVFELFSLGSTTEHDKIGVSSTAKHANSKAIVAEQRSPILRPVDPSDFLLFSSKDHPKPF